MSIADEVTLNIVDAHIAFQTSRDSLKDRGDDFEDPIGRFERSLSRFKRLLARFKRSYVTI